MAITAAERSIVPCNIFAPIECKIAQRQLGRIGSFGRSASRSREAVLSTWKHGCVFAAFCYSWTRRGDLVQVLVRDNNVDQALRALKKKMQREGVFREMKLRRNYEKPSERRAPGKGRTGRRYRKLLRKRLEREGY